MAIKIDNKKQLYGANDDTKPLVFHSPGGLLLQTATPITSTAILAYDTKISQLKYYDGTKWVILGSIEELQYKANKNTPSHYGINSANRKYLTVEGSTTMYVDPVVDGFVRFPSGGSVVLSNSITFSGAVTVNASINCSGNVIANISNGAANDAINRGKVDSEAVAYNTIASNDLRAQYTALVNSFNSLVQSIYNEPFPAIPTAPEPIIPPPVVIPPPPVVIPPPIILPQPPLVLPDNPIKHFVFEPTILFDDTADVAWWALYTATLTNFTGYKNTPRIVATGSTFYVKFIKLVLEGYKGYTGYAKRPFYVTYTYNGSNMQQTGGGKLY